MIFSITPALRRNFIFTFRSFRSSWVHYAH
nr:MAG TPA: hypothetical protein [Caudoviricetes sp.]